jgi:hypothetical protein
MWQINRKQIAHPLDLGTITSQVKRNCYEEESSDFYDVLLLLVDYFIRLFKQFQIGCSPRMEQLQAV